MNYFKKLWQNLGSLSNSRFGLKYYVPAIAILFTYVAVGHLYVSHLSLNDFKKQKGQPSYTDIRYLQGKYRYYPLYIKLDNFSKEFRLMDTYKKHFQSIQEQVDDAKEITIYYRTPFQKFIGLGRETDIMHITNGNTIVFSMETVAMHNRKISLTTGFFAVIFWFIYFRYKNR